MTQENETQPNNSRWEKVKKELKLEIEALIETLMGLVAVVVISFVIAIVTLTIKVTTHENFELASNISYITDRKYGIHLLVMINSLEKVPEKQLKQLNESGYDIIISKDLLNEYYEKYEDMVDLPYNRISGLTMHNEKVVCIKPDFSSVGIATLHEVGHILDKINGNISITKGFKEVFEEEKENTREYSKDSATEFFADVYSVEISKTKMLTFSRSDFPKTIKYLKNQEWW